MVFSLAKRHVTVLPSRVRICGVAPGSVRLIVRIAAVVLGCLLAAVRKVVENFVRLWGLARPVLTHSAAHGLGHLALVFGTQLGRLAFTELHVAKLPALARVSGVTPRSPICVVWVTAVVSGVLLGAIREALPHVVLVRGLTGPGLTRATADCLRQVTEVIFAQCGFLAFVAKLHTTILPSGVWVCGVAPGPTRYFVRIAAVIFCFLLAAFRKVFRPYVVIVWGLARPSLTLEATGGLGRSAGVLSAQR